MSKIDQESSMPPQYVIRRGAKADCAAIHDLIMELAVVEEQPNEPTTSVKGLIEDGFGEGDTFFKSIVAETTVTHHIDKDGRSSPSDSLCNGNGKVEKKTVIGHALYFFGYSTWDGRLCYMENICVAPKHRGHGIGTALMRKVAKLAADVGCVRMQWAVLGWNKRARRFYEKNGSTDFTEVMDWHVYNMRKGQFLEFAKLDKTHSIENIVSVNL